MASTNPGVENVRAGVIYTIDDVSYEGTMVLPAASNVRAGVAFDHGPVAGTLQVPDVADVREATPFDDGLLVGELQLPAVEDVRAGVAFDDGVVEGTLDLPAETDVKSGVEYDGGEATGSYVPNLDSAVANLQGIARMLAGANHVGLECVVASGQALSTEDEEGFVQPKARPIKVIQGSWMRLVLRVKNAETGRPFPLPNVTNAELYLPAEADPAGEALVVPGVVFSSDRGELSFELDGDTTSQVNPSEERQDAELRFMQDGELIIVALPAKLLCSASLFPPVVPPVVTP